MNMSFTKYKDGPIFDYDMNETNNSEAGPEVALLNDGRSVSSFDETLKTTTANRGGYDTRTITKQTVAKLQSNSKFGTFTRKACETVEKFHLDEYNEVMDIQSSHFPTTVEKVSDESGIEDSPSHEPHRRSEIESQSNNNSTDVPAEVEDLKCQLNEAYAERDQALAALRAYELLLKRINEKQHDKKKTAISHSPGNGRHISCESSSTDDSEKISKRNAILERTVDNLEQTVQDTMARMNEIKDVNQEMKNVLSDQQDMLAQYKSTIEQKSFEYRDLQVKHENRIDSLIVENKRDRALLEKQITLLRAEAHMKSLENERLESECRIKGEQLARLTEMLNELRKAY